MKEFLYEVMHLCFMLLPPMDLWLKLCDSIIFYLGLAQIGTSGYIKNAAGNQTLHALVN